MTLLDRVHRGIAERRLLPAKARIIVAVSGGPDSVALLHLLIGLQPAWRWTLHIAHLDHGLREESGEDAEFVRKLGALHRIPTTIDLRRVSGTRGPNGASPEEAARSARYAFLTDVARRESAGHIALGHTADDQAETVLLRLIRGTGLMGLGAMAGRRELDGLWLIRPLLEVWREELMEYLARQRLAYRRDATNADPRFMRNRIRGELLPLLARRYNPNIKSALTQLAEQSRVDYAYLDAAAARQWKRAAKHRKPGAVALSIARFLRQPQAIRRHLVRGAIQRVQGHLDGFEFRHWVEAERLFVDRPLGARVDLPGGVQLCRDQEHVEFVLLRMVGKTHDA